MNISMIADNNITKHISIDLVRLILSVGSGVGATTAATSGIILMISRQPKSLDP